MEKRDILLLFFCLPIAGKKEILSPIQIMKSMFLLSKENEIKDFYRFHPYLYGPCSLEVYKDIDSLVRDGFISQVPSSHRWKYFKITKKGEEACETLFNEAEKVFLDNLKRLKDLVLGKNLFELLNYVYESYPEYAENSIVHVSLLK